MSLANQAENQDNQRSKVFKSSWEVEDIWCKVGVAASWLLIPLYIPHYPKHHTAPTYFLHQAPHPLSYCTWLQVHLQQVHYTTLHLLTLHQTSTHCTILHLFTHQQVHCTLCALCRRILRLRNLRKVAFIATLTAHPLHPELYCRLPPSPTCHQAAPLSLIQISRKQNTDTKKYAKTQQIDKDVHNHSILFFCW